MMTQITLIRHGVTHQNDGHIVQGQDPTQGRLTLEGQQQALLLGHALKDESFDEVHVSPLERAVLTFALIALPRRGTRALPLRFAPELREIHLGELQGGTRRRWFEAQEQEANPMDYRPSGGESWREVARRVEGYLYQHILRRARGERILVVAHGGVNRCLIATLTGLPLEACWSQGAQAVPQDNACINRFWLDAELMLERAVINDTRHLAAVRPAERPASDGLHWDAQQMRWTSQEPTTKPQSSVPAERGTRPPAERKAEQNAEPLDTPFNAWATN